MQAEQSPDEVGNDRTGTHGHTVRFIPIVVIVPEDVLPLLNARTDTVAEQLISWSDLKRRNGWSDEAIVAGTILANALRVVSS